ncbi:MAG: hypothetical protein AAFR64_00505 [Pseudomonadota bacterium]
MSPLLRAVAIVIAVKFAVFFALLATVFAFPNFDSPNQSTIIEILAVGVAMWDYSVNVGTKPSRGFLGRFGLGVVLSDYVLLIPVSIIALIETGQPFSIEGLIAAFGGGEIEVDIPLPFVAVLIIGTSLMTFLFAYFLAWVTTRKLPGPDHEASTFE